MKFNSLIPELSVSNIERSKKFYLSLGFKIMYEREENKFIFLQFEENQIMIEENNGNWDTGTMEYPYGRGIKDGFKIVLNQWTLSNLTIKIRILLIFIVL